MNVPRLDRISRNQLERQAAFAALREAGPVIRGRLPLVGSLWVATTHEAVTDLLRDSDHFARDPTRAGKKYIAGFQRWMPRRLLAVANNMLAKDGAEHRRLRGLVEQAFVRQNVERMRPRIREIAESLAQDVAGRLDREATVDLVETYNRPLPLAVICELLGLPPEDRPQFIRWGRQFSSVSSAWGLMKAIPGMRKILRYLSHEFERCRSCPRPGLMSALVEAEQGGEKLSHDELIAMGFLLLLAGHETTVHLIGCAVVALLQNPDQLCRLKNDWSLAEPAVQEVLRFMSPAEFSKPRFVREDMSYFGQHLKQGEYIIACLASANHDPARFDSPEHFVIDRHPNPQLTFGSGPHICLGLKLAKAEVEIALETLWKTIPEFSPAVSNDALPWSPRLGFRALTALPVSSTRSHHETQLVTGKCAT